ncbi:MAG TPA: FcoT family thioesterase [Leptolyngbyaceae cyanobacterium]
MNINQEISKVEDVSQDLVQLFLEPYKDHCKYLRKAQFQYPKIESIADTSKNKEQGLWSIKGEFSIPESCYIAATGHFNSVEFNICYNQLCYTMIAHLIDKNLWEAMRDWDLPTYKQLQLSNFLIVKFSSIFRKPIDSQHFLGSLSINKCSVRGDLIIVKTSCAFYDQNDGWSEGDVTFAVLNGKPKKQLDSYVESVAV